MILLLAFHESRRVKSESPISSIQLGPSLFSLEKEVMSHEAEISSFLKRLSDHQKSSHRASESVSTGKRSNFHHSSSPSVTTEGKRKNNSPHGTDTPWLKNTEFPAAGERASGKKVLRSRTQELSRREDHRHSKRQVNAESRNPDSHPPQSDDTSPSSGKEKGKRKFPLWILLIVGVIFTALVLYRRFFAKSKNQKQARGGNVTRHGGVNQRSPGLPPAPPIPLGPGGAVQWDDDLEDQEPLPPPTPHQYDPNEVLAYQAAAKAKSFQQQRSTTVPLATSRSSPSVSSTVKEKRPPATSSSPDMQRKCVSLRPHQSRFGVHGQEEVPL